MRPNPLILALLYALALATFAGCGGESPGGSPEEVAQAFADAMAAGDTAGAAELWSYVSEARSGNPDWDEFPSGQRSQIISRMQDAKAGELKGQTGQFAADMKAGPATVSGTSATVALQGGASGGVVVRLQQADGKWGVAGFGPAQATR